MSHSLLKMALAGLISICAFDASAAVVVTQGPGSAVTTATNSAYFDLSNTANPYYEDGIEFNATNSLACGNNSCGSHSGFFPGFSGNYFYTADTNAYISIRMANNSNFTAVEFVAGTGFYPPVYGYWQTYDDGQLTGSGTFSQSGPVVIGLQDAAGFDEVRYFAFQAPGGTNGFSAPGFDTVRIAAGPTTADITGTITNSLGGGVMSGITVANSGAPSTSTDGSGVYSFTGLAAGSYTITPSVYNYVFTPTSRTVNLAGVNATGQNFVGTYNGIPDITDLRALVVAANLTDTRVRNSLLAPLDAALVWLNGSNPNKVAYSCSNLAKFIAATRQNISVGKLPAATGNPWIVAANDILSLSGCPTR